MPRFSTSLLFQSSVLLAAVLVTVPSRLHAETTFDRNLNLQSQTSTAAKQANLKANSAPIPTKPSRQLITPPKQNTGLSSTGSIILTPTPVVTSNNSIPTTPQQPTVTPKFKPTVTASTAQPPVQNVVNLLLKLNEKQVYVYKGDKIIAKYPVAIGKKGWETPTGEWQVMEKIKNPAWTSFKTGEVVAAGKQNPLGQRWIGFWTDGQDVIGFHGTPDVKSIGTEASHGCVRMFDRDVKALFPLVQVGTTVKVVN
ncbi:L,D-transpeptidase family protein [Chamaesiphon sp. VAR_48_metabat_135_sub]|uniref:L,D-transpeptidase n=1 Tax=Chamaesiphon sp. VAR_48_metabat_135_sub TaxID=2964699 RepID=UPI00286D5AC2|nr:L,D-transpeptidase family protein [Chamaesiphon sp. VAR_48_metabat_135_sub]